MNYKIKVNSTEEVNFFTSLIKKKYGFGVGEMNQDVFLATRFDKGEFLGFHLEEFKAKKHRYPQHYD